MFLNPFLYTILVVMFLNPFLYTILVVMFFFCMVQSSKAEALELQLYLTI
jgi:hypothetical protein